jgi:hypothetical protein
MERSYSIVTNRGLFEPKVMYFGMINSPATFQALMNLVFADLIAKGEVAVYMDDILIYTAELLHHRKIVREVLKRLEHYCHDSSRKWPSNALTQHDDEDYL